MDRRAGLVCRGARPPLNPLLKRCLAMNLLISRYTEVRRHTTGLVQPLSPEDCTAQSMPDASPKIPDPCESVLHPANVFDLF